MEREQDELAVIFRSQALTTSSCNICMTTTDNEGLGFGGGHRGVMALPAVICRRGDDVAGMYTA